MAEFSSKKATFEDAIIQTGYGKFNIQILLASGGCLMVVIIETMAMMMIVPAAQCDLQLDLTTKGILNAISFLGVVSGSHMWGFIADTKGRRNVLIFSMLSSFITSLASSIVPWAWLFIVIRYVNGFFVGGASAVVYAYVGEFHDKTYRPKVVSWIATFVAIGNIVIPGFAWAILPLDFAYDLPALGMAFRPWRLLVICYGTPSFLFALWLLRLPESPKYLMSQGRSEEAMNILRDIYAENSGKPRDSYPIGEIIWDEHTGVHDDKKANLFKKMWLQTVPLFQRAYVLKTFMVCLLQFGAFASSSGLIMWYPEILNRISMFAKEQSERTMMLCDAVDYFNNKSLEQTFRFDDLADDLSCSDKVETNVFMISLLIGSAFAVIYIFVGIVINAIGPKNLLIVFLVISTSSGLAAQNVSGTIAIESLIAIFLGEACCVGVINAIVVDLFPTHLRAMALSLSLMAGRLGAVTGSNFTGPLIYDFCDYTFYVFGLDHLILVITVFLLPSSPSVKKMIDVNV